MEFFRQRQGLSYSFGREADNRSAFAPIPIRHSPRADVLPGARAGWSALAASQRLLSHCLSGLCEPHLVTVPSRMSCLPGPRRYLTRGSPFIPGIEGGCVAFFEQGRSFKLSCPSPSSSHAVRVCSGSPCTDKPVNPITAMILRGGWQRTVAVSVPTSALLRCMSARIWGGE